MTEYNLTLDPQYTPVLRLSDDRLGELVAERNNRSESDDVDWHDLY